MGGGPDEPGDRLTTIDPTIRRIAHAASVPTLATGDVIADAYELGERLGAGGMGTVYRARDRRLGRAVAVKVLRLGSGTAAEHARELFEREARATAQLLHPNIVTLHHVGEQDGCPYLVLELLSGETLAQRLARRRKLAPADAFAIVDGVLAALAFAHEHGVLHRDLKPNNVFLTVDDRVKVLDFGLAVELDRLPGPGALAAGTPGYMAPEQRDGGDQDERTDVWAAGLLLLECVSGRRCEDSGTIADAIAELDVTREVRDHLTRALASDPDARPATAGDMRVALQRASTPLVPRPPAPKQWRRRIAIAAIGAACVGAGVGVATLWRVLNAPPPSPSPSELSGTWQTNFGLLALRISDDGETYGVYEHDKGIVIGRYRDGLFIGRWCELPTYRDSQDAGTLQLQFVRNEDLNVVDGRWSYGDSPDLLSPTTQMQWHTGKSGFFGEQLDSAAPPALAARLQSHPACQ